MRKCGRCRSINPNLSQNGIFNLYALRDIEEDASTPEGGMQGCVFRAIYRHTGRHKVLLYEFRIVAYGCIQVGHDDALAFQFLFKFDALDRGIALDNKTRTLINQRLLQRLLNRSGQYPITVRGNIGNELLELEIGEHAQGTQVSRTTKGSRHTFIEIPGLQALL